MICGSLELQGRDDTGTATKSIKKSRHLTHSEPITQRKCYLQQLGFGTAEMLPMGATQGQPQPPAGIKLEGGSAAGAARPGTALQVWSPFLLLIVTRFRSRYLSLTSLHITREKNYIRGTFYLIRMGNKKYSQLCCY